jgi:PadR family transcriptional regulator PadR
MMSRELVAASSRPVVLSILARGESYGYEIIQQVKKLSDGTLEWTEGMLYPVLHRLEKEGIIESEWKVADTGRKRKYYKLNQKGKKVLAQEREQWQKVNVALTRMWEIKPCLM